MAFIELKDVSFSYEEEEENTASAPVLQHVNLEIAQGEFIALLGHNGSGKSTLAKLLNGMLVPSAGKVLVEGLDTAEESARLEIRRRVGLVQQNPDNQLVASIVEEDVAFGPENLGVPPLEIRQRVDDALKAVNMYEYREHAAYKLSGGQKQRVAIAGVIAMQTNCVVLDESTAMLDPRGRQEVMDAAKKLHEEKGITVILITHHMEEAVQAQRVVILNHGQIVTQGTPEEVFSQVEMLKRHQLDVPQATELLYRLQAAGVPVSALALDTAGCVETLRAFLQERGAV